MQWWHNQLCMKISWAYIYIFNVYIYHIRHNGIKATKRCKHRLRLQREISRVAKKKKSM